MQTSSFMECKPAPLWNVNQVLYKAIALSPLFEITFASPVWRVRPDEKTGWLAIEVRDADSLMNGFQVIQSQTGAAVLSDYQAPEGWWSGLDDLYDGWLYLHGKGNQRYGRHQGITAVDPATGQICWQQPDFSFYGLTAEALVVRKAGEESLDFTALDRQTGHILSDLPDVADVKRMLDTFHARRQESNLVPGFYPAAQPYFKDLDTFIRMKLAEEPVLGIDFLETGRYFVLGYYVPAAGAKMHYRVAAFSLRGDLLLQQELAADCEGIGSDYFFILQDTLILIKNRRTLLGFAL
jgi:hypothetical protein